MPEYIQIPKEAWERMERYMEKAVSFIESNHDTKSKWLKPAEAMRLIGCKETKIKELRQANKITWRHNGNGRGVMILRKSVEDFIKNQSSILKIV